MKITVEFESMDEFETFRTSGKKTRGKSQSGMSEVEEAVELQSSRTNPADTRSDQERAANPMPQQAAANPSPPQHFAPPHAQQQATGFPGGNSGSPPASAATNKVVTAIIARIDGALASGQSTDAIVAWFRQQIGDEAKNATVDQLKQIFVPRMTEAQLKQIAPQLGIPMD